MIAPSVGDIIELPDMVMTNIANWKDPPIFNETTHYKWPFSIAMLVYQRVNLTKSLASPILIVMSCESFSFSDITVVVIIIIIINNNNNHHGFGHLLRF